MSLKTQLEFIKTFNSLVEQLANPSALKKLSEEADKVEKLLESLKNTKALDRELKKFKKDTEAAYKEAEAIYSSAIEKETNAAAALKEAHEFNASAKLSLTTAVEKEKEAEKKVLLADTIFDKAERDEARAREAASKLEKSLAETEAYKAELQDKLKKATELV